TRSRMIERSNSLNTDPIASAPRFQPPPGRFSITTLWRKALPTYSAVTRAATSMRPPFHGHSPRQRHDLDAVSLRQNKVGGKLRRFRFRNELRDRSEHDRLDDTVHLAHLRYVARLDRFVFLAEAERACGRGQLHLLHGREKCRFIRKLSRTLPESGIENLPHDITAHPLPNGLG